MAIVPLTACRGGVIARVSIKSAALRRLIEMGATPGARVDVIRRAPLGDPIQIALRGSAVTLLGARTRRRFMWRRMRDEPVRPRVAAGRRAQAQKIRMEKVQPVPRLIRPDAGSAVPAAGEGISMEKRE